MDNQHFNPEVQHHDCRLKRGKVILFPENLRDDFLRARVVPFFFEIIGRCPQESTMVVNEIVHERQRIPIGDFIDVLPAGWLR
jgi:hypothetical protein